MCNTLKEFAIFFYTEWFFYPSKKEWLFKKKYTKWFLLIRYSAYLRVRQKPKLQVNCAP
jgi:hypothetical protein